jgi:hypothetical protein
MLTQQSKYSKSDDDGDNDNDVTTGENGQLWA